MKLKDFVFSRRLYQPRVNVCEDDGIKDETCERGGDLMPDVVPKLRSPFSRSR